MSKFLNPTTDIVFKRLFGSKAHKNVAINFLNNVLERKNGTLITDVEFLDTFNQPNAKNDRLIIVDLRCIDQANKTYIIEVQARSQKDFGQRGQYYASRVLASQLNVNDAYDKLTPVIFVGVLDFILFERHDRYISHHAFTDLFDGHNDLNLMELHFIELAKFKKSEAELATDMDRWIFFLSHASEYMDLPKKVAHDNEALVDAFDIVSKANWSKVELEQYELLIDRERCEKSVINTAHETGMEKGIAKGTLEAKKAIARQMMAEGIDVTIIAKVTGLSEDEIKEQKGNNG